MGKKKKKKLIDKIKVGDKLWYVQHGWVTVYRFGGEPYPIVVKTKDGELITFTDSDKYYSEYKYKSLFKHKMRVVRAGKSDLSNAKVGDKVECVLSGRGAITKVSDDEVIVLFRSGQNKSYYMDGRNLRTDKHPSLYLLDD